MLNLDILLAPPIAFVLYLALVGILAGAGRLLAGRTRSSALKMGAYSSGEAAPRSFAISGYRPFFTIALFFAILHLGVLMLGSANLSLSAAIYLIGLMMVLLALILG